MTFVAKRWTPKGFAAVADRVLEEGGRVLLVGSPGEREVSAETRALIGRSDGVLDITGLTTLPQLAAVIERCDVFLGNDTGPMHLACAVGTPTVAIFGPSNPVMYPPYSPYGELIYRKVYCSPCLKDGLYRFAPDCVHECMTAIGPAEPLAAMRRAMARKAAA
jgi:ADP-heptose:LPS heptosyltransferase